MKRLILILAAALILVAALPIQAQTVQQAQLEVDRTLAAMNVAKETAREVERKALIVVNGPNGWQPSFVREIVNKHIRHFTWHNDKRIPVFRRYDQDYFLNQMDFTWDMVSALREHAANIRRKGAKERREVRAKAWEEAWEAWEVYSVLAEKYWAAERSQDVVIEQNSKAKAREAQEFAMERRKSDPEWPMWQAYARAWEAEAEAYEAAEKAAKAMRDEQNASDAQIKARARREVVSTARKYLLDGWEATIGYAYFVYGPQGTGISMGAPQEDADYARRAASQARKRADTAEALAREHGAGTALRKARESEAKWKDVEAQAWSKAVEEWNEVRRLEND